MAKKRPNTAKTGDQSLYKSREAHNALHRARDSDDDQMYDRVDRFHNNQDQDYIQVVNPNEKNNSDDDDTVQEEGVMDLGLQDEDSDESSSSTGSDEYSEKDGVDESGSGHEEALGDEDSASSSDDDDDDEDEIEDVRDWGRKKSAYYHGDTGDLEIGQDEEDAYLEEDAAKEVQAARYRDMSEDDFGLSDTEEADNKGESHSAKEEKMSLSRESSKMTLKEKRRYLDKQHPEMLPLLSYFTSVIQDLNERTHIATRALLDAETETAEAIGATLMGQKFLLTKYITQVSVALNLCAYLLLKSEQSRNEEVDSALIQSHPVMSRLQKLYSLIQKLEDNVENRVQGIDNQLSNLAKAAVLMTTGHISDTSESSDDAFEDSSEEVSVKDDGENGLVDDNAHSDIDEGASQGSNKDVVDEEAIHCGVLNEARFGLRADELLEDQLKQRRRRQATSANAGEFNDETEAPPKSLASTLNSVEQRSASKKRNSQAMADGIDETQAEDDQLRRGIEMMEAEFGKDFDKVGEGDDDDSEDVDPELDDDDFYSRVASASKSRKDKRKQKYEVAPKYPRLEGVVEGERGISKQIMKNRGLVAHKNKLNRNPRVKKREQYRKAVIRRKGAVRDVRTDEGHKYDGEGTGIKSNVSRSRKLAR